MLSFISFIVETGDTHYPFKKIKTTTDAHRYSFTDGVGNIKHVDFDHRGRKSSAELGFHDEQNARETGDEKYGPSGELGTKSIKVFSTIKHIIDQHAKEHPHLKSIHFDSRGDNPTRTKLYHRMAKHAGGDTDFAHWGAEHVIPVNSDK